MATHESEFDPRNAEVMVYVDGVLLPRAEAKVSVYDSGFMLGDGMWEGLRLHEGRWLFFEEHMERFFGSCRAVGLDAGVDRAGVLEALNMTAAANGMRTDAHCRLMLTRGVKERPFQRPSLSRSGPTFVIIMEHARLSGAVAGVRLATVSQVRGLPTSQDAKYNSHSKLNCVLACLQAEAAGADEALMLDPHGFANTTNSCNFFIVRGGEVWTSTGDYCMNGVTRAKVLELCRGAGIPAREKNFSLYEVYSACEVFLSGTYGGLASVLEVDGKPVGDGVYPVTERLRGLYADLIEGYVSGDGG
ncbi:MAG: aminotransferase class IV [Alphaproteobacteria bacterium]|nr:aminotransferase class IV [Alphaproteobacteria bacterium]MDA8001717.1 aminotransferase class IV [Alphaproteobacteria bacterium]MDA8004603.1 aminotransferase class IV [Alphaproteobacteria bacterium]MDA8006435.1 aminotransferase class IV [Alphaproteobacteria bacterium]MDA8013506.1 aminotransferase class IV [Alphaproteobacteria bacterium]